MRYLYKKLYEKYFPGIGKTRFISFEYEPRKINLIPTIIIVNMCDGFAIALRFLAFELRYERSDDLHF